jgi:hypothetical protein
MRLMAAGEFSPYYHAANVNDWHEEIAMSAIWSIAKKRVSERRLMLLSSTSHTTAWSA